MAPHAPLPKDAVSPSILEPTSTWRPRFPDPHLARTLGEALDVPLLLAGLLVNRGVTTEADGRAYLTPNVDELHDPFLMADMDRAAERVVRAVRDGEPIVVYGDVDVDGLSGTALLVQLLRFLGAEVSVYVPNRAYEGYSFTPRGMAAIFDRGAGVVISVDNGTSALEQVAELQERGVDVVITDHHLPGDELPPAHAMLNPHRADCRYPNKHLAGVGVAFKLACAIATTMRAGKRRSPGMLQCLGEALGWVAIGTISDIMPLVGENRILVARGLAAAGKSSHPGLCALRHVAELGDTIRADDVAFRLAPRLNAAGRLDRSEVAVELMTCSDDERARALAATLQQLNTKRQEADRALSALLEPLADAMPHTEAPLFVGDDWVPGILGLVAGRIARRVHRPAVCVSFANGEIGKGSVRTVRGFDAHEALAACAEHLEGFGGHAMAAGFSIRREQVDAFREAFAATWTRALEVGMKAHAIEYEAEAPLSAITELFVSQLERLEPFGNHNPRPVLGVQGVTLHTVKTMGADGHHFAAEVGQGGPSMRAVAFGKGSWANSLEAGAVVDVLATPKLNRYRGRTSVELELVDVRTPRRGDT